MIRRCFDTAPGNGMKESILSTDELLRRQRTKGLHMPILPRASRDTDGVEISPSKSD